MRSRARGRREQTKAGQHGSARGQKRTRDSQGRHPKRFFKKISELVSCQVTDQVTANWVWKEGPELNSRSLMGG